MATSAWIMNSYGRWCRYRSLNSGVSSKKSSLIEAFPRG
jgi:hypothetical protein